jgi:hypothetical protein
MPRKSKAARSKPTVESAPIPLPAAISTDLDLAELRRALRDYRPLFRQLHQDVLREERRRPKFPRPSDRDKAHKAFAAQRGQLVELFATLKGAPLTPAEAHELLEEAESRAWSATTCALDADYGLDQLITANLAADGTYRLAGGQFMFTPPGGQTVVFANVRGEPETPAEIILLTSITVEVIGLLAALAGVVLPTIPIGKIATKLRARLTSPSTRREIAKLRRILGDANKTIAEKLAAIFDYLGYLSSAGLLSDILAQILADLSWWRIALLIAQLIAQLAIWLVPGAQAALVATRAIAVANAVLAIVTKGRDLGDMLK